MKKTTFDFLENAWRSMIFLAIGLVSGDLLKQNGLNTELIIQIPFVAITIFMAYWAAMATDFKEA